MRIAINTLATKRQLYGVGHYIKNLISSLSNIDDANEYFLFVSSENRCHFKDLKSNFRLVQAPSDRAMRLIWEQSVLPWTLKQKRVDVFHGPTFIAPLVKTCPQIVTIHDMTFHLTPKRHELHKRIYFGKMIPTMIQRSDLVIAISQSTKNDLLRFVKTREDKICVIHHGVEPRFQPVRDEEQLAKVRQKYDLPREFILFVGLIEPRKNLKALVDAYVSDSLPREFDLVLAGNLGWNYSGLRDKIAQSGAQNQIRMPGYIADADLPALYSMAATFVYPSLYEGFGLPVLEAMACGAPVITSSVSAMPEVAGDAAILVDPNCVRALADAMQSALKDCRLRHSLSKRGRERAQLFTWEQTARKTLEAYSKVGIESGQNENA